MLQRKKSFLDSNGFESKLIFPTSNFAFGIQGQKKYKFLEFSRQSRENLRRCDIANSQWPSLTITLQNTFDVAIDLDFQKLGNQIIQLVFDCSFAYS